MVVLPSPDNQSPIESWLPLNSLKGFTKLPLSKSFLAY
jgi:hypothetical protein